MHFHVTPYQNPWKSFSSLALNRSRKGIFSSISGVDGIVGLTAGITSLSIPLALISSRESPESLIGLRCPTSKYPISLHMTADNHVFTISMITLTFRNLELHGGAHKLGRRRNPEYYHCLPYLWHYQGHFGGRVP